MSNNPYWFSQHKGDLAHVWGEPWLIGSRRTTICGISIAPKDYASPFYKHYEQPRGGSCLRCIEYLENTIRQRETSGQTAHELLIEGAQVMGIAGSRLWSYPQWQEKALQYVERNK